MKQSTNDYDWLGHGVCFWENNLSRAMLFAKEQAIRKQHNDDEVIKPAVIGAVIDLGYCLDLLDSDNLSIVKAGYESLKILTESQNIFMPENKKVKGGSDFLIRKLDCAVIQHIHTLNYTGELRSYDSVRGVFWEGVDLYPSAGFKEKNHIQICVCNPECIKGLFYPICKK